MAFIAANAEERDDAAGLALFEEKIRPVLVAKCYQCHAKDAETNRGDFLLDTRAGIQKGGASGRDAVIPGNVDGSQLIEAIRYADEDLKMPPKHPLLPEVVADFEKWIGLGAPDPRDGESRLPREIAAENHWAFKSPESSPVPKIEDPAWNRNSVDPFIFSKLRDGGLKPSPRASKAILLRRVTLELTGLPPSLEEIMAFQDDSRSHDVAFSAVVDRLLKSPEFGRRWARHWLDVARFGESSGYSRNMLYPHAWRYRNYVIDAFNADIPVNQFIREQIAGDLLPAGDSVDEKDRLMIATGFLTIGAKTFNESDVLKFNLNTADDQIDATCRAFLALTVNCSRCHDHKYDPISAQDYYAMAGIFLSTRNLAGSETNVRAEHAAAHPLGSDGWKQLEDIEKARERAETVQAAYMKLVKLRNEIREPLEKKGIDWKKNPPPELIAAEAKVQAFQENVKSARAAIPDPPRYAMAMVDGLKAEEVEVFSAQQEERKELIAEMKKQAGARPPQPIPDQPKIGDSPLYDKGEHKAPLQLVPRGALSNFSYQTPPIPDDESGRLQLAEWIVDERNPLTARVYVNRVWHHLFGRGLVGTVDNFGVLGDSPTHLELLDRLALEFMENGWSTKWLIRKLVATEAYQQSSEHHAEFAQVDPDNRLLWRFAPQLLEGEAIRDSILAVSGQLDLDRPKTSQVAEISKQQELGRQREIGRRDFYKKDVTWKVNHRSVFLPMARGALPDMLAAFDAADPNLVIGARTLTIGPTQSLYLMNSDFVLEKSAATAESVLLKGTGDRLTFAYQVLFGREPRADERESAAVFFENGENEKENWRLFCQALICTGEFRTIY